MTRKGKFGRVERRSVSGGVEEMGQKKEKVSETTEGSVRATGHLETCDFKRDHERESGIHSVEPRSPIFKVILWIPFLWIPIRGRKVVGFPIKRTFVKRGRLQILMLPK